MMKTLQFYLKPLIAITLINLLFFYFFGIYFDTYEGMISSILQCTYSASITNWWDSNIHFLLLYVYEQISLLIPEYNVYGVILIFYNFSSLTLLGLILYRILVVNLEVKNLSFFLLLYAILSIDNFVNINTTRQAFVLITAILVFIESRRFEHKLINRKEWLLLVILMIFASLLRFEAVLLFSSIYIVLLLIYRRLIFSSLLSFLISGIIFIIFTFLISNYSSEAKKVFTYKEKEIIVRNNIDINRLSEKQLLEIQLLKDYYIADEIHYKLSFYDAISKYPFTNGILSIFDGIRLDYFLNTLKMSQTDIVASWCYILFYFLSGILLLFKNKFKKRQFLYHYTFLFSMPFLLCLHSIVPLRFLIPFFSIAGCLNIIIYFNLFYFDKRIMMACLLFCLLLIYNAYNTKKKYQYAERKYIEVTKKLLNLDNKQHALNPIIIYQNFPNNYFPVQPHLKLQKQHALFFNFYLFSSDEQYVKGWSQVCDCNSLSMKEKMDYMVKNQNLFLVDEKTFDFLKTYFLTIYNTRLTKTTISDFDKKLIVCKVNYE